MRWRETPPCGPHPVTALFFGKRLYAATQTEVTVWGRQRQQGEAGAEVRASFRHHRGNGFCPPTARHLVTSDGISTLSHWKLTEPSADPVPQPSVVVSEHKPLSLALTADGRRLALSTRNNAVLLLDHDTTPRENPSCCARGRRISYLRYASLRTESSWPLVMPIAK